MKKNNAVAWCVCFAALLLLPRAVWTVGQDYFTAEATENTVADPAPTLTRDNYLEYAAALEGYYNNNVPFRSQLITANSLLDLNVFQEKSINDKVVVGEENWLFYSAESNIQDYKGSNLFTRQQLELIADNLVTSEAWLENRDCEFVLFLPPNKETIYGEEHLPSYYKKGEQTRIEQLISYLEEETDIRVVYPEAEMKAYKDDYALYWHYDTHWNAAGGYIGAKALLAELGIEIPPVEEITFTPDEYSGYDLARMMNLQAYYETKKPKDVNYIVSGFDPHNMQIVSLDDPTALVYQSDSPDERNLFMVRDSFAGGMAGVLASNFKNSYMAHWNGFFEQSMVDEQAPDVFVLEVVERRLDYLYTFRLSD